MYKRLKVVLVHDAVGDGRQGKTHVFETFHGGVEIEVGKVDGHEFGIFGGDHTVEEALGGGDVGCGSADFARVVDSVASDGEANSFVFLFLRSDFGDDAKIGGFAAGGNGSVGDEVDGFSARLHVWKSALGEAANFVGGRLDPFFAIRASFEVGVFKRGTSGGINDGIGGPWSYAGGDDGGREDVSGNIDGVGGGKKQETGLCNGLADKGADMVGGVARGGNARGSGVWTGVVTGACGGWARWALVAGGSIGTGGGPVGLGGGCGGCGGGCFGGGLCLASTAASVSGALVIGVGRRLVDVLVGSRSG